MTSFEAFKQEFVAHLECRCGSRARLAFYPQPTRTIVAEICYNECSFGELFVKLKGEEEFRRIPSTNVLCDWELSARSEEGRDEIGATRISELSSSSVSGRALQPSTEAAIAVPNGNGGAAVDWFTRTNFVPLHQSEGKESDQ